MEFINTVIRCKACNKAISVRKVHVEQGFVPCSHRGCTAQNKLTQSDYDPEILNGLPSFGELHEVGTEPPRVYSLRAGVNVIGTSPTATVCLPRDQYTREAHCFISRFHCTLTVAFDAVAGCLRYTLHDGTLLDDQTGYAASKNGTTINGVTIQAGDVEDLPPQAVLGLGGADFFRLTPYLIPATMLASYKRTTLSLDGTD